MEALRESLRVPARMAWKGDPCTPSSWEGVKCHSLGHGFVIKQIVLTNKGLKGYITGRIMILRNLDLLNLSSNCITGDISSLVNMNLVKLVSGNKDICGVGIPSLPECSLWTMLLHSKLFAAAMLILIGLIICTLKHKIVQYDPNNPNFLLVVSYGVFRMRVAFCITLFHFLRVMLLYIISDFSVDDSYVILRFTATEQILLVLFGACLIVATLRGKWGQTKGHFLAIILCFSLFSMHLSFAAAKAIYNKPWLMSLERIWVLINYGVLVGFYHMSDSFDLKGYLVSKIGAPLLQAMRSMSLIHYTYLMLAFCYMVSAMMAY
ncbi:hypothetical protein Bca52824_089523 [Brassica carinata]|uniref:Uncharacterized protein n=1 Tax=Brassica carinata TaxID=52824 RepID=A0A8X7PER8_BRACI|nr:hypothetical protein Bca52824_089523 [Brassica carinata]